MPDRVEVKAVKNGVKDYIEVPTQNESILEALQVEREGYERRLERGETHYGGEDISVIIGNIDGQIVHYGGRVEHADFVEHTVAPQRAAEPARPARRSSRLEED